MDPNSINAYNAIMDLRFADARKLIQDERTKEPNNGITILLEDYMDYLHLTLNNNKADYDKLLDRRSDRLDALEDNDKNSPWYLFSQAEVYMHWGVLKSQYGDYISSMRDLNKARKLLTENNQKFKDFTPNKKSLAWTELLFGAIPSNVRGVASMFGLKGNIDSGYRKLEAFKSEIVGSKYSFYNDELIFLIGLINVDVLKSKNNYDRLMAMSNEMNDKSLLKKYLQGYISFKMGHATEAINYFSAAPQTAAYMQLPIISYWLGNAKLCRMDKDADDHFQKFLTENKGSSYIKETYLKLAYHSLLQNDVNGYNNYIKLVRSKGAANDEKDKQALKEANDSRPDIALLKARFYFDGGYYSKALDLLKDQQVTELKLIRDKIEYYYRLGRTYDRTNNVAEALANYDKAIAIGRTSTYYYAANAAVNSGVLYEQKKDSKKAAEYFNAALQMKNHEYQNSIDTQAKEGLARVKGD
ncbi:hypothetical protein GCM10028827_38780 [Mucilaginibacter myungsuensis]